METNIICTEEPTKSPMKGRPIKNPPIKDINKWPAIILAVKRKVKAIGRIKFLSNSTNTINLIRAIGVPAGIRWFKKSTNDFNQLKLMIATQKVKAKGKVNNKWEVTEKIKGNKAIKLYKANNINAEPKKRYTPFTCDFST